MGRRRVSGGPPLVYSLEVIDAISFRSVGGSTRKWQDSLGTVANNLVLGIRKEIRLYGRWDLQNLDGHTRVIRYRTVR